MSTTLTTIASATAVAPIAAKAVAGINDERLQRRRDARIAAAAQASWLAALR